MSMSTEIIVIKHNILCSNARQIIINLLSYNLYYKHYITDVKFRLTKSFYRKLG